ncbi:MAG: rRNA maturation RNase YbeY [Candidatus Omnitrophota bacterium]|nr:MAG: rRNA maturation RNase YbeY [Candidatus Omnitrophota bacterium]
MKRNTTTDVIAFDISNNKNKIMADIVVSADQAKRNAAIFKTSCLKELCLYVIHGVLHILGYKDKTARQRKKMQQEAEVVLAKL